MDRNLAFLDLATGRRMKNDTMSISEDQMGCFYAYDGDDRGSRTRLKGGARLHPVVVG